MKEKKRVTAGQVKDAGMALSLLCFLVGAGMHARWLEWTAMAVLVVDMTWPPILRGFAMLWFGLAEAIGTVTSKILLSLLFFLLVTPIGVLRRATGKGPMVVTRWKRDHASTFVVRDRPYSSGDVEHPF